MNDIGRTAKYLRSTKGITQRAAAELLGISYVHLCNIENGKASPSPDLLGRFSEVWDVDLHILSWCLHGDISKLPKAVRGPMSELAKAWRSELEGKRIIRTRPSQ
jgi:transcriptional regulator with XRE-family HTH domain